MVKKQLEDSKFITLKKVSNKKATKKIKLVDGEVKNYSRYNALKHGMYADLPMYCNDCVYRSEEAGGNGKCDVYKEDALCGKREDIKKHCQLADSRNPDDLKSIADELIELIRERVLFGIMKANMDGNVIDKQTTAQMNLLHSWIKLAKELSGAVKVTEVQEVSGDADFVSRMFRQFEVK